MTRNPAERGFEDLNTYLYREVKRMIREKILSPGTKIKQEDLAQALGVSRTPVIKVLQRLDAENVVEYLPRRGFYVKRLTLEEMLEVFSVREVVEGVSARAATENATDEEIAELASFFEPFGDKWTEDRKRQYRATDQRFHSRIIELARKPLIVRINEMFNIFAFSYQKGLMRPPSETLSEHRDIIRAIQKRDPREAQRLAMIHIERSRNNISRVFQERKGLPDEMQW